MPAPEQILIRRLGRQAYEPVWRAMRDYTDARNETSRDELWIVEHPPVFTLGQAGKAEHLLNPGDIPVVKVDRGGQVTYHGPGQLVIYLLLDIRRMGVGVRDLVSLIEDCIIQLLSDFDIEAVSRRDAPGVYVDGAKIAALGLRIRKGCSYHGLSLNLNMNLEPFSRINPCGYQDLPVTQLSNLSGEINNTEIAEALTKYLMGRLGYNAASVSKADALPHFNE